MSPRSTTLPLYFWNWGSNFEFLRWQRSISDAKWTFLPLFLASSITSFFLCFWLLSAAMPAFLRFFPFYFHCCLRIRNFQCLSHWNKLVYLIVVMVQWIIPFARDVIFVIPVRHTFQSYPQSFVDIDNTSTFGLFLPNTAASFPAAIYWCPTRHCCWHRNLQLSTSIFLWCVWILHPQVQWRRYHVTVWHYRALVSR